MVTVIKKRIKRRSGKRWSKDELVLLRDLVRRGLSFTLMVINDRSALAIAAKARSFGLRSTTRWTTDEVAALHRGSASKCCLRHVRIVHPIDQGERSPHAVHAKAVRLGLVKKRKAFMSWSDFEIKLLTDLVRCGYTPRQIKARGLFGHDRLSISGCLLPARSVNALAKMVQRLRLGNSLRSARSSLAKQMMNNEKSQVLNDFIKKHGIVIPVANIAKHFGVASSTVRRRRAQLGLRVTWRDAVVMPDSKFKSPRYAKQRSARVKRSWQTRRCHKKTT